MQSVLAFFRFAIFRFFSIFFMNRLPLHKYQKYKNSEKTRSPEDEVDCSLYGDRIMPCGCLDVVSVLDVTDYLN